MDSFMISSNYYDEEHDYNQQHNNMIFQNKDIRYNRDIYKTTTTTTCPCLDDYDQQGLLRQLEQEDEKKDDVLLWQVLYTCFVLLWMFIALLSDRVGADSVMLTALTAFMALNIITIQEGLIGFANEGLLTVITLFVVAEGISKTGALDWYMGKLLGRPQTTASAQLRLMIPIAIVSAFLNNTPVVAVMIPIVQRWGKNIKISPQQLLIPLSFASILGGTCTLIGTSTNLVVVGLLQERYPNDPTINIGLFDLGEYGVPIAIAGICYLLVTSPFLIPGSPQSIGSGNNGKDSSNGGSGGGRGLLPMDNAEDILLGARLAPWSPAAGRSVKRSGLRDTGGIYLVSVERAATGNVHRAVGQEFVLNVGDRLYFTAGLNLENFGIFCEEHGLEVLTNELQQQNNNNNNNNNQQQQEETKDNSNNEQDENDNPLLLLSSNNTNTNENIKLLDQQQQQQQEVEGGVPLNNNNNNNEPCLNTNRPLTTVLEDTETTDDIPCEVGVTMESLIQADDAERLRNIHKMTDMIRGTATSELSTIDNHTTQILLHQSKIVVTADQDYVVVGIDAPDRPGLLLDVSKGLLRLNLSLRHTEASVVGTQSISIWRCEVIDSDIPDLEEIWSVLNALLENEGGIQAVKERGLRVIRALVTNMSSLIGKTAAELDFRKTYKAAIVAIQKDGKNTPLISTLRFGIGDILVLQASDDSPLLQIPPPNFYNNLQQSTKDNLTSTGAGAGAGTGTGGTGGGLGSRSSSVQSFVNMVTRSLSSVSLDKTSKSLQQTNDLEAGITTTTNIDGANESGEDYVAAAAAADDDDDDDYFFETKDESATDSNDHVVVEGSDVDYLRSSLEMTQSNLADVDPIAAYESVWKDLQVYFGSETSGDGDGGGAAVREFLTASEVANHSTLANRSVVEIGLDKLPGVYLVSIDRPTPIGGGGSNSDNKKNIKSPSLTVISRPSDADSISRASVKTVEPSFTTISQDTPLKAGDVLWFAGSAQAVGDLRKIPGLISYESEEVEKINEKVHDRRLVEAVIARRGPLVGKTVKEVRFRTRYGAAVIAIHRDGTRIHDHPGKIKLQAGDVLLLEAGPTFIRRGVEHNRSFALLAEVQDSAPPRLRLLIPALVITAAMLIVFTVGVASLLVCALVASVLMVTLGILSEQEARDAVNWEVYITIAAAFGIGTALVNSGVAGGIASFLVDVGEAVGIGDAGLLGAVYFATFLISNVVTNNAAAALLFPIALDAAEQTGTDRVIMSYCLMLGASASFMSPFGYTTNLLIYGPGGYKYKDFLQVGTPMQVVLWVLSILFLSMSGSSPWWLSWILTSIALVLIVSVRVFNVSVTNFGRPKVEEETIIFEESK